MLGADALGPVVHFASYGEPDANGRQRDLVLHFGTAMSCMYCRFRPAVS